MNITIIIIIFVIWFFTIGLVCIAIDDNKERGVIIAIIASAAITFACCCQIQGDLSLWNNGYCKECGEKWELFDITRYHSEETYYYKDKNGHVISTNSLMEGSD